VQATTGGGYEELRKLAAAKIAQQTPCQTLQATALVHEAYLRLTGECVINGRIVRTSSALPPKRRAAF
jgi:hypothetical protein